VGKRNWKRVNNDKKRKMLRIGALNLLKEKERNYKRKYKNWKNYKYLRK
jgi:hypothetical protein